MRCSAVEPMPSTSASERSGSSAHPPSSGRASSSDAARARARTERDHSGTAHSVPATAAAGWAGPARRTRLAATTSPPGHMERTDARMHRRTFLKSLGALAGTAGAAGLLTACGNGEREGSAGGAQSAKALPKGEPTLNVVHASIETVAGSGRRFAYGLTTTDNVPLKAVDTAVYVRDMDGKLLSGPYASEFHDEGGSPLGLYVARIDVPEPGSVEVVVAAGDDFGTAVISVIAEADSSVPTPGKPAVAVATPTNAAALGVAKVCTNDPPCPMHEISLDQALREKRPVALMFATPAYCASALCGPAVGTLDKVRASGDWKDVAFIHVEIFKDEGQTTLKAVQDWGLRSEPWFFAIDRDGTISERVDGPMIPSELSAMVRRIASA
jgi:hypothetical protein